MQILIVEKNKRTICSCLTYSALMYILKVKPLKYLSVNHSLYYHRWFDMQCILKSVGKECLSMSLACNIVEEDDSW